MLAPVCALLAALLLQPPEEPASPLRLPGGRTQPPPPPADAVVVDAAWVATHFGEANVVLVDLRDAAVWAPFAVPPSYAAGHIPMSLPFDFAHLLAGGAGWPSPPAVLAALRQLGPRSESPVDPRATFVLYGGDESESQLGLGYLLLSAAGLEARVFAAGWREWRARPELPVVRVVGAGEIAERLVPKQLIPKRPATGKPDPGHVSREAAPRGPVVLDLREASDFRAAHLPGARNAPSSSLPSSFEAALAAGWPDIDRAATPIVLYCYGATCVRSFQGSAVAARHGFRNILWLREGLAGWRARELPLEADPAPPSRRINLVPSLVPSPVPSPAAPPVPPASP